MAQSNPLQEFFDEVGDQLERCGEADDQASKFMASLRDDFQELRRAGLDRDLAASMVLRLVTERFIEIVDRLRDASIDDIVSRMMETGDWVKLWRGGKVDGRVQRFGIVWHEVVKYIERVKEVQKWAQ